MKHKIFNYFKELKENTLASFVGLFVKTDPKLVLTDLTEDKKKIIEDKISHILEKSKEIEEVIPDFNEKYLYAEGEDFALFIYFVKRDVAVSSIFLEKPKFAVVLLEHEILAKKIKDIPNIEDLSFDITEIEKFEKEKKIVEKESEPEETKKDTADIEEYIGNIDRFEEKQKEEKEKQETKEENIIQNSSYEEFFMQGDLKEKEGSCEIIKEEETASEEVEEVPSLEDLIKESIEEYERKKGLDKNLKENIKRERGQKEEFIDPIILEHIEKEFVKEIGPIAKLILNRKMSELNIDPNRLKTEDIITLIQELAKEIRIEEKKEKFINEVNDLL